MQVGSTLQNLLSEQLDKGEVKKETGAEKFSDEESPQVVLSISDIHTETCIIRK